MVTKRMGSCLVYMFVMSNLVCWSGAEITCYKCKSTNSNNPTNETDKICVHFEPSEEYEVNCPYSTFCMKKTAELDLPGGRTVRVEERKCAPQNSKEPRLENNKWVDTIVVKESIYKEGCTWEKWDEKAAKVEYCYCSSNYCNTGQRTTETSLFHHTDAMSVIFIFNVVKLMRSIR